MKAEEEKKLKDILTSITQAKEESAKKAAAKVEEDTFELEDPIKLAEKSAAEARFRKAKEEEDQRLAALFKAKKEEEKKKAEVGSLEISRTSSRHCRIDSVTRTISSCCDITWD